MGQGGRKIVIAGGGGHAKVLISILKQRKQYEIVGYTDPVDHGELLGVPYLGPDDVLSEHFERGVTFAALGVGGLLKSELRIRVYERLKKIGFHLPVIIASSAVVQEKVEIGEGSVVLEGAIVNADSRIGKCAIINTNSSVGHDCRLGDFVHVAPRAVLGGGVVLGDRVHIGLGASVIQYVKIAANVIIGAGSLVVRDCLEPGKYVGVPAKLTR